MILAVAGLGPVIAGVALARGGPWQPLPVQSSWDWACGATAVHGSVVADNTWAKETDFPDGRVALYGNGSLKWDVSTESGASVIVNSSGPGTSVFYPDGSFELISTGESLINLTPDNAAASRLPEIFVSQGPLDLHWSVDGTVSGHAGPHIKNICAALGA